MNAPGRRISGWVQEIDCEQAARARRTAGGGAHFVGLPLGDYQIISTPEENRAWMPRRLASGLRGGTALPRPAAALVDLLDLYALGPPSLTTRGRAP